MGAVTPIGKTVPSMWQSIQQGKSGVAPITLFDASSSPVKIAAEIKDFKPEEHGIDPKEARRMARFTQYLLAAANEAVADAKLTKEDLAAEKTGIIAGNGLAGMDIVDASYSKYIECGKRSGRIVLEFYDSDDREALIQNLARMGGTWQEINRK